MLNYKSIGKRIRHYRKRRGYTQEQLGLSINTSGAYISNIERGVKKPSLDNLASIAETLDVTVNDMILPMHDELAQRKINDWLKERSMTCLPTALPLSVLGSKQISMKSLQY